MKKIQSLVLLFVLTAFTITSCTDNSPVKDEAKTTPSISLRTMLKQVKKTFNPTGRDGNEDQIICFDFVYPITLSYNNDAVVTVSSLDGLVALLEQETPNLYLEGIEFPFQVQQEGAITTINNEDEFMNMIQTCDFDTVDEDLYVFDCYQIVYPFSVVNQNNQTITINSEDELYNLFASPNSNNDDYIVDFVYPLSLTQADGQVVQANNIYELFDLMDQCDGDATCVCPTDVNPVCVSDGQGGVITFSNACNAECAGYSESDFVDCGIVTPVNFGSLLGSCFMMSYPVQVQYQGALVTVNSDAELLQYYFPAQSELPAFSYPVSILFSPILSVTANNPEQLSEAINQHCN